MLSMFPFLFVQINMATSFERKRDKTVCYSQNFITFSPYNLSILNNSPAVSYNVITLENNLINVSSQHHFHNILSSSLHMNIEVFEYQRVNYSWCLYSFDKYMPITNLPIAKPHAVIQWVLDVTGPFTLTTPTN